MGDFIAFIFILNQIQQKYFYIILPLSEKITDEKNTSEDWGMIMDFCDRVQATKDGPRDCLKSIMKRLNHQDPHVVIQAVTVIFNY